MHKTLAAVLIALICSATLAAAVLSNEKFCENGIDRLADSLIQQLSPLPDSGVILAPVDGPLGKQMLHSLTMKLQGRGAPVFLVTEGVDSKRPVVKTSVDDYHLTYEGFQRGFFSQGRVLRRFGISGASQLVGTDARLLQATPLTTLLFCDTLSYDDARTARGRESFLSPKMPATLYQRLVEPGLVLGITGALVYLFFASR